MTHRWTRSALLLAGIALLAAALAGTAAARVDANGAAAAKTVNVGFIYPKTGGLSAFGQEEFDGFNAGLAYVKGKCGGYTINPTFVDDATDPATAIAAAKNLIGQGYKILTGTGFAYDNNWAPITLDPDGAAYVGTVRGLLAIRDGTP